jgi:diguanylate cyclase (GGDEF)-like protein
MTLDIQSILVVLLSNVFATAVALPLLMGWRVSTAARLFQAGVIVQAFGWLFFLIAPSLHDRALTALAIGLMCVSFALLWSALDAWLGARPGKLTIWALAALTPLGYALSYPWYPVRVGWSNAGLALQMAIVCLALAWPAPQASRRWRGLAFVSVGALAIVTLWRGVLGAFFTEAYPFFRATHPANMAAALLNHVALALGTLSFLAAWREEAERKLKHQAQTDGLTGLPNRQAFAERAVSALAHAARYDEPISVVMIDIDHFKQINDSHGHAAGDTALQTMARGLHACVRADDLICRYGGEEFCVLLSRAGVPDAVRFDERLRAWLAAQAARPGGETIGYSAGVASRRSKDTSVDELMQRADAALYQAKAEGRGRLVESRPVAEQGELKFEVSV